MRLARRRGALRDDQPRAGRGAATLAALREHLQVRQVHRPDASLRARAAGVARLRAGQVQAGRRRARPRRSEEHTSELQSLMRISYAVFCLQKKKTTSNTPKKP